MTIGHRGRLTLILLAYLLITLGYGALNPLFEAPDEHHHYFTVQYFLEERRLPSVAPEPEEPNAWIGQEAAQPPLYYLLGVPLIAGIDTGQAKELVWFNPRVQLGDASSPTNTNAFVHADVEEWPWQDHVLAAHLLRAFSTFIGLGTLLFIYGSARLVWPEEPRNGLLATALVAFLPQFNFLNSAVSNDPLVVMFSAAALWQLLRLWYDAVSPARLLLLGLTIGLAMLSKMAGLLLLLYACGFLLVLLVRGRPFSPPAVEWRRGLGWLALVSGPALLLGGWLLWRNWLLYGDITATSQFIRIAGGDRNYTLWQVLAESNGLWLSLFAVFGWFNVRAPQWIYLLWNGLVIFSAGGALLQLLGHWPDRWPERPQWRQLPYLLRRPWAPAALLAVWLLLVYAGLVQFMLKTPAAQGRLLFPALVPLSLAFTYGLSRYRRAWVYWLTPGLALLSTLYSLFFIIPPAYAPPPLLSESEIPAAAPRLDMQLGEGIELLAAELETESAEVGGWVWLTLYWQRNTPYRGDLQEAPEFVLELFGRQTALVGKLQSYHGGGLYPASLWPEDAVIVDRLAVRLDDSIEVPSRVKLNIKLVGGETSLDVGALKVTPHQWPDLEEAVLADLDGVELAEAEFSPQTAQPGEPITIELRWQVQRAPGQALTTFVHLGQPGQPPLVQGDGPALGGDYPTQWWAAGEVIDDSYQLVLPTDLPSGRYPLQIGLYDPETGLRRPLTVDGERQAYDAYVVGWVVVNN